MGYTPTEWESGDVITAEKLNKIESGIDGASGEVFEVFSTSSTTVNKTYTEVVNALLDGKNIFLIISWGSGGPTAGVVARIPLVGYLRNRISTEDPAQGDISLIGSLFFCGIYGTIVDNHINYIDASLNSEETLSITTKTITFDS